METGRGPRRPSRPIMLRRGRTRRGYWITVTSEDREVIQAIERGLRGTGLPLADGALGALGTLASNNDETPFSAPNADDTPVSTAA